ncbi:MAG: PIN domain-containing protein [Bacteroidales bacterium]|nr:PIN domain-containing protein [Bacteroidales bacterium]
MKRVFLDTNILLDAALRREHCEDADNLLQLGDDGEIQLCASCISYITIAYVLRHHSKEELYAYEQALREGIDVLSIDSIQLDYAINNPVNDFEDMMQYCCAKAGKCDVIITNNKKDFLEFCDIPVMTAAEFVRTIN